MPEIKLGDKVRYPITELVGIAYSRMSFLHGPDRIGIQSIVDEAGCVPSVFYVDEPQLEIVKREVVKGSNFNSSTIDKSVHNIGDRNK